MKRLRRFFKGLIRDRMFWIVTVLITVALTAGYAILLFGFGYTWTIIGVLVSAGLVVSSFAGGRNRGAQS